MAVIITASARSVVHSVITRSTLMILDDSSLSSRESSLLPYHSSHHQHRPGSADRIIRIAETFPEEQKSNDQKKIVSAGLE